MRGYAGRPPTKAPNWHGLVVYDLLFNNLTTGLFIAAALGELVAPAAFAAIAVVAYPAALLFLLADLLFLVLDLGDPMRFHHMLRIFKAKSPMSVGTWSLVAFSIPVGLLALMSVFGIGGLLLRQIISIVGLVPALAASMYKGVLFSTTAQPGWRDARWLGGWLSTSAVLLGAFGMATIAVARDQLPALVMLRPVLLALLVVNGVTLLLLVKDVKALAGAVVVGGILGTIVPLPLVYLGAKIMLVAAAVLVLAGAYVIRAALVKLPHEH